MNLIMKDQAVKTWKTKQPATDDSEIFCSWIFMGLLIIIIINMLVRYIDMHEENPTQLCQESTARLTRLK